MALAGSIPISSIPLESRTIQSGSETSWGASGAAEVRALTQDLARTLAVRAGFTESGVVGLPHAEAERDAGRFAEWIDAGRAGTMDYLARRDAAGRLIRSKVDVPFPWARSVVVCLASYHAAAPLSTSPADAGTGWIARYAWSGRKDAAGKTVPSDYHKVLLKRLRALEAGLRGEFGDFESRAYVDTGPVVERSIARAAGVGWTGKNTCLIHPKLGSWNFLAVLVTSLELPEAQTPLSIPDRCGSCTRCLDACPTQALVEPYRMDASRCISYLTIEHRGRIGEELLEGMGRQVFGCDICQDVCPWNRKAPIGPDETTDLAPRAELINPALEWLAGLKVADFERLFNGSPVRRAGFWGFKRNIAIAMGNSGLVRYLPWLAAWSATGSENGLESRREAIQPSESAPDAVREAARWGLRRIASANKVQTQQDSDV